MAEVSTKELAAALDISVRAVNQAVYRGVLVPRRRTSKGNFYDLEASKKRYEALSIPANNKQTAGEASEQYSAARAREKEFQARLRELELQRKSGELVSSADVRRDAAEFMAVLKSALYAIPDRVAPLFGERQPEVYDLLTKELGHALESARSAYIQEEI